MFTSLFLKEMDVGLGKALNPVHRPTIFILSQNNMATTFHPRCHFNMEHLVIFGRWRIGKYLVDTLIKEITTYVHPLKKTQRFVEFPNLC